MGNCLLVTFPLPLLHQPAIICNNHSAIGKWPFKGPTFSPTRSIRALVLVLHSLYPHHIPQSTHSSTMKMEAAGSSKTLVNVCQTTRHHIPKNSNLQYNTEVGSLELSTGILHFCWILLNSFYSHIRVIGCRQVSFIYICCERLLRSNTGHCAPYSFTTLSTTATRFAYLSGVSWTLHKRDIGFSDFVHRPDFS
jgi:hypothetical protein